MKKKQVKYNSKFEAWLFTPTKNFYQRAIHVFAGFLLVFIIISIVNVYYGWMMMVGDISKTIHFSGQFYFEYKHQWIYDFFLACVIAPLAEEIMFRHIPLQIMKRMKDKSIVINVMLFISVIFAYCHNMGLSVPIQGVMGFVMCVVYIKNGFNYWSSVTLHFMWNFALQLHLFTHLS